MKASRHLDASIVALVALVARLAVVVWASPRFPAAEDGHYYDVLARRLAAGDGYTWLWPDGAITYAAHYPVGYSALLALSYRLAGASTASAMTLNALVGVVGAYGVHRLVDVDGIARWRPFGAGLVVALHPALVPYTAAVMTEGVTAAWLVGAAALAARARSAARPLRWWVATGGVMAVATLVRPQSLLLAPVLGWLAASAPAAGLHVRTSATSTWRRRLLGAAVVSAVTLAVVMPWTARNCVRLHRCALVSVNGGWNLLIGAQTHGGGWEPVDVPPECATVWDEAAKDACFGAAGRATIAHSPRAWLARVPGKIAATFDYFGAAPWYLHSSNPAAFGEAAKVRLGAVETVVSRVVLLAALVASATAAGPRTLARRIVALGGAVAAATVPGWLGYLALVVEVGLRGPRGWTRAPLIVPCTGAVVLLTAIVHGVFFGAGRYGLVVAPFVAAVAFVPCAIGRDRASPVPPLRIASARSSESIESPSRGASERS